MMSECIGSFACWPLFQQQIVYDVGPFPMAGGSGLGVRLVCF